MSMSNILVHVDDTERCKERIAVAAGLAQRFGAHVTGLYVVPDPEVPLYIAGAYVPKEWFSEQMERATAGAEAGEKMFREAVESAGAQSEWRREQGALSDIVARHGRYADMVVVGKGDAGDLERFPHPELAADVVMTCGRPVLVIPNAGHFKGIGQRVLVCWNAGREATRAVNDALPVLKKADHVTVLAVNPGSSSGGDHGEIPCADIAQHLARHQVKAEAASAVARDIEIADLILARASDLGADMIVSGAYGHSRTREWVFGGVTESLMRNATVPYLLSH